MVALIKNDMLRITQNSSAKGAASYFDANLGKADYYATGEHTIGSWGGQAAERLGLQGEVSKKDFIALCNNRTPDGNKLNPRDSKTRKIGYDFTFSVPKSVSVAYAITGDERIRQAFERAVEETMQELERDTRTQVGQGKNKKHEVTGNMVWASFTHRTSRPVDGVPDCHLHRHCFAFNTTWNEKQKRFQAFEIGSIKKQAPYYEAAFDARLARQIQQLGYGVETRGHSWELQGIERNTIDKFSRRTGQIEAAAKQEAKDNGFITDKQKDKLGSRTRAKKQTGLSYDKLREVWHSWLTNEESGSIMRAHHLGEAPAIEKKKQELAKEAVSAAVAHSFERKSVMEEKQLMGEALKRGYGDVLPEDIQTAMKETRFYRRKVGDRTLLTTEEAVQDEKQMVQFVRKSRGNCAPINPHYQPKAEYLNADQKAAIHHALSSVDQVSIISGGAGTGKTTLMKEVRDGIEESGKQVFGFAPSAAASRGVMKSEGFEKADTLARLLVDKKLQEQTRNQVIWVDEAGLIGNKDMNRLFAIAKEQNARILLTGDIKQHSSVAAGDALRILEQRGGIPVVRVNAVQRQRNSPDYKKVVEMISNDQVEDALAKLDRMGGVIETTNKEQRLNSLVKDYMQAVSEGKSVLVVSPVHKEANQVTRALREELKASGVVGKTDQEFVVHKNLNLSEEEKTRLDRLDIGKQKLMVEFHQNASGYRKGERWQLQKDQPSQIHSLAVSNEQGEAGQLPLSVSQRFTVYRQESLKLAKGDKIRITKGGTTMEGKRVNNGDVFTIEGFSGEGNIMLGKGKTLSRDFGHLAYGYVSTSHSSQGKTVDRVFIAQSEMSSPAASKQQFYVSLSRGREQAKIYTDDKVALQRAVMKDGKRMTASEVADHMRLYQVREMLDRTYSSAKTIIKQRYASKQDRQLGK